jgi:hypothetical protein
MHFNFLLSINRMMVGEKRNYEAFRCVVLYILQSLHRVGRARESLKNYASLLKTLHKAIIFKVLTAVATKISIVWDIAPCGPLKVNRRHLNLQFIR